MSALARIADGRRLTRFVIVGVGAALLLLVLSYLFVRLGMTPFAGSTIAYAIAFAAAYTAQRNWTFEATQGHGRTLPRYFVLQAGCAMTSGVTAHTAVALFGASPLMMSVVTTIVASAVSFVLSSLWVFAPDAS
ncbi:MAG: GtrA family protein [Rhizobiaceae bacterium]